MAPPEGSSSRVPSMPEDELPNSVSRGFHTQLFSQLEHMLKHLHPVEDRHADHVMAQYAQSKSFLTLLSITEEPVSEEAEEVADQLFEVILSTSLLRFHPMLRSHRIGLPQCLRLRQIYRSHPEIFDVECHSIPKSSCTHASSPIKGCLMFLLLSFGIIFGGVHCVSFRERLMFACGMYAGVVA